VLLVTKVLGQLLLRRRLEHLLGDRLPQLVRAREALPAGASSLDQLTHRGPLNLARLPTLMPAHAVWSNSPVLSEADMTSQQ